MPRTSLTPPPSDPTLIFEHFRGSYGTELLTAAVAHFGLFDLLAPGSLPASALMERLELQRRPFVVLTTALKAMGLLREETGTFSLTELSRAHLVTDAPYSVVGYVGLAAQSPGVREMIERLCTNRPAGERELTGAKFIYRDGLESAMENEASARELTLALAGRAKNVAPYLARSVDLSDARVLLDIGGGTGIYSIALLERFPHLRAIVLDRPEVLKVAAEFATEYGVADRLELCVANMFTMDFPAGADVMLLSNILHDWDEWECRTLLARCHDALPAGGQVLIHDVFLNDALGGPLPIALYSAALFTLTEGRAYSAAEYAAFLRACRFVPGSVVPTFIHCGVIAGRKPA